MSIGLNSVSSNGNNDVQTQQNNTMGKDAFLSLLVTQLQYQDPLNPMDSTDFTAQLAQFSSLEQLNDINDNLEYMHLYQASINNSQAVSFIGKEITASGTSVRLNGEDPSDLNFELSGNAAQVTAFIYDSSGRLARTIEVNGLESGMRSITWDGINNNGGQSPEGEYTFDVMATDINGNNLEVTTYMTGKVTGVTFRDKTTYLVLDGQEVAVGSVIEVSEA